MSGVGERIAGVLCGLSYLIPVAVVRRTTLRQRERNAFEIGREYERGQQQA